MVKQSVRAGKDVQQVKVIKDRDRHLSTNEESVLRRWWEHFKGMVNEENERERKVEEVGNVEQEV